MWKILAFMALALPAFAQPVLRVGLAAQQGSTFDPHRATATEDVAPVSWMFGALLRFPPGSADPTRLEGDLADSWEGSADGLTWLFRMRPGVVFHDGRPVTAADAVASLRRAADPARSSFASDYADVAAVEAIDPMTVRLVLRRAVPSLPSLVANYHGGMIVPAHLADAADFGQRPVGTGPFMLKGVGTGGASLVAFAGYRLGAPKLGGIELRYLPSDQVRELALVAGEIDLMIGRREQRWVERMRAQPGIAVDVFGPGEFRTLLLNRTAPPLDDLRVRRAVAQAVDVGRSCGSSARMSRRRRGRWCRRGISARWRRGCR